MKKYWQLLLIALVIIATISVHYIQVAKASNQSYNLLFEKISGDDKYIDSLTMEGYFESGYTSIPANITKDDTTLLTNPFLRHTTLTFRELIDQHKAFMRGKEHNASNYYEDEARLIYVEEPDEVWKLNEGATITYNIDVLNKDNDTSNAFSVSLALNKSLDWISVQNTVVVDNELKFLTNYMENNGDSEVHLVVIDLKKQQLVSDTILDTVETTEIQRSNITIYNEYENFGYEKYVVYSISSYNPYAQEYEIVSQQFKILNIETNEVTNLEVPESIVPERLMGVLDNNNFVISILEGTNLVLYQYNIGQKRWLDPVNVKTSVKIVNNDSYTMQATKGKIYLINKVEQGLLLQILDIDNHQSLYEGILKNADNEQNFNLSIYRFHDGGNDSI
jgi:hypothetical protein